MRFGIRLRFAVWLLAVLLPVGVAAIYVFGRIEHEVSQRVASDLESLTRLEASRIEQAVEMYQSAASRLADDEALSRLTAQVVGAQGGGPPLDGVNPFVPAPLQSVAASMLDSGDAVGSYVAAVRIVDRTGEILGESRGFEWTPHDADVVRRAMRTGEAAVGNAFRNTGGRDRVGIVAPIMGPDGVVVGALMVEHELGPIVQLVQAHESFGATSEAILVQATPDGAAEAITSLRFEDDAAFSNIMPTDGAVPTDLAMSAPEGRVLFALDYRGQDTIIAVETLDVTGWGLIVKIDRAEALQPILMQTRYLKGVAALGVFGVLIGWALLLDPVARRLRQMASAAERVASGDYETPLDDRSSDEIGSVATSIDRLATDLATDIAVRTDIEDRLRYQATRDATTGLYNRQYATTIMHELAKAASDSERAPAFSLLFLDLDKFKSINDRFGHAAGDSVLATAARRLLDEVGSRGLVARWGGDEFVVVLPATAELGARAMALNIEHAFATPIVVDGVAHEVRASIGSSTHQIGLSLPSMLRIADEAMFIDKQKHEGSGTGSPGTIRAVERALARDEVEVHFQPLVSGSGATLSLLGAEALVRLRDHRGTPMAPKQFLPEVERSPIGRDLDRRVLQNALAHVGKWIHEGSLPRDFRVSVNCCEAFLSDDRTPAFVARTLSEVGLHPRNLMLEISEHSSNVHPGIIDAIDQLGVSIAIDDLGMSNSNIDRLVGGRASVAKIDRRWLESSVSGEGEVTDSIARHLVKLCESFGFKVIAEGVETNEQYAQLSELGVSEFQGYLFARPLSVDDFALRFFQSP